MVDPELYYNNLSFWNNKMTLWLSNMTHAKTLFITDYAANNQIYGIVIEL